MKRCVVRALRSSDRAAVRHLVQLYIYDIGGDRWDVDTVGRFGSRAWHRRFWTPRGRRHFVVLVSGRLAGFALVRERAHFAGAGVREISEFFVLRKYRRRGVGTRAARTLFARFPGRWEVAEVAWNVAAQRFWRQAIRACAVDGVAEGRHRDSDLDFVVQRFTTRRRAPIGRDSPRARRARS